MKKTVWGLAAVGACVFSLTAAAAGWPGNGENLYRAPGSVKTETPEAVGKESENIKDLITVLSECLNIAAPSADDNGHITVKVPASAGLRPSLGACPNGSTVTGTDSVGMIVIGPGGGSQCDLVFGTPFAEPPSCVVSSNMAHPTPKRIASHADHVVFEQVSAWNTVTNDFSGQLSQMLGGEKLSYLCIGFGK